MRHEWFYQEHFVAIARHRIGVERADVLLHDASFGRTAGIARLNKALDVQLKLRRRDDRVVEVEAYDQNEGSRWHGASLHLDRHIPDTLQAHLPERRLGDVASGTGADGWTIKGVCDQSGGTTLMIESDWIRAKGIKVPPGVWMSGPFRRFIHGIIHEWWSFSDRSRLSPPTPWDMVFHVVLLLTSLIGAICGTVVMSTKGVFGIVAGWSILPAWLFMISGLVMAIRADILRWPRTNS